MAPCNRQVKANRNLTCSCCDSRIYFTKYECINSVADVQADYCYFVCSGFKTVKYPQEQFDDGRAG